MAGLMALIGGDEFAPGFEEVHAHLLKLTGAQKPRVVYVPTGAAHDGRGMAEQWATLAVERFAQLGANASALLVLDREAAQGASFVALGQAHLIYLGDGKPQTYLTLLRDSGLWKAIAQAHEDGALLAGAGAGAMVMAEFTVTGPDDAAGDLGWAEGFGLVRDVGVIPHYDGLGRIWSENLIAKRPARSVVVGIDEQTALVGDHRGWQVLGRGGVTVIRKHGFVRRSGGTPGTISLA